MELLKLPEQERAEVFRQIRNRINLNEVAVEKDWWVTAVLRALFALPYAENLSFKGGTSLSKCYNLIERFSEDVDIAINREFFGFTGETFTIKQISKNLRKATCQFVRNSLQFDLARQMEANVSKGLFSVRMDITPITTIDPEKVVVEYKSAFNASPYIKNTVILEIGGRSMKEPLQKVEIYSFVDKHFPQAPFAEKPFAINAVVPERTFWEKICLLHEEFSKQDENTIRVERMSRHIYDLAKMMDTPIAENSLKNRDLFQSIANHRRMFIAIKGFDYDTLTPATLNIIPPDSVLPLWKQDYETMQGTMIYGNSLSFNKLIDKIKQLNERINRIDW